MIHLDGLLEIRWTRHELLYGIQTAIDGFPISRRFQDIAAEET